MDVRITREVVNHGKTQLQKGWSALDVVRNLCARYGLTERCAQGVVGVLVASRKARPGVKAEAISSSLAKDLDLSEDAALALAYKVVSGALNPDNPATIPMEFDPARGVQFVLPPEEPQAAAPAAPRPAPRPSGPVEGIQIHVNLLRSDDAPSD